MPTERITYFHRRPKSVLRALAKVHGEKVAGGNPAKQEPYEKAQILDWINAAAPMAASELINQLVSPDEDMRHRAAVKLLEWAVGKPPQGEGGAASIQVQGDRRILIEITDPQQSSGNGNNIIDAGAAEGGTASDN